jgi:hypothetical protein
MTFKYWVIITGMEPFSKKVERLSKRGPGKQKKGKSSYFATLVTLGELNYLKKLKSIDVDVKSRYITDSSTGIDLGESWLENEIDYRKKIIRAEKEDPRLGNWKDDQDALEYYQEYLKKLKKAPMR